LLLKEVSELMQKLNVQNPASSPSYLTKSQNAIKVSSSPCILHIFFSSGSSLQYILVHAVGIHEPSQAGMRGDAWRRLLDNFLLSYIHVSATSLDKTALTCGMTNQ
jgi:hypothetical protein